NLIDGLPLSETETIKPYEIATGRNYIDWLVENAGNVQKLESEDFGEGIAPPHALLYLMLRYALLHEGTHGIFNWLETAGISGQELVRSRKFMNISTQPDVSHWEIFRAPANRILPNESSNQSLLEFVQIDRFTSDVGRNIADAKDGLTTLAKLPT